MKLTEFLSSDDIKLIKWICEEFNVTYIWIDKVKYKVPKKA